MAFLGRLVRALFASKEPTGPPTYRDYDHSKAESYVFNEAAQFPVTVIGFGIGVVCFAGFALLKLAPLWFFISIVSLIFAFSGFAYKYIGQRKKLVEAYFASLDLRMHNHRESTIKDLVRQCMNDGFEEGGRAVEQVRAAVEAMEVTAKDHDNRQRVQEFLDDGQRALDAVIQKVAAAFGMWKAIQQVPVESIEREIQQSREENARLKADAAQIIANNRQIESNRDLLDRVAERRRMIAEAIAYCTDIENALHHAQIEMPMLLASNESLTDSGIAQQLRAKVEMKVRVEEEMMHDTGNKGIDEEKFRQLARKQKES